MTILTAAKNLLISRALDIFTDMRDGLDLNESGEYQEHFGDMGIIIHKIDMFKSFGDVYKAIENGEFSQLALFGAGDEEDLVQFIADAQKYMEKYNRKVG
jgi:DNA polymerase/3'-5' exonuclease PolX